jgi:hypothetical protein
MTECRWAAIGNTGRRQRNELVRQLPDNGGDLQYRIKSAREPHERVVKERDLRRASASGISSDSGCVASTLCQFDRSLRQFDHLVHAFDRIVDRHANDWVSFQSRPRTPTPPIKSVGKCNPCVRYEMEPISRAAHRQLTRTRPRLLETCWELCWKSRFHASFFRCRCATRARATRRDVSIDGTM